MNTMQVEGYKAEKGNESTSKGIGAPKYQLTKKKKIQDFRGAWEILLFTFTIPIKFQTQKSSFYI